MKARPPQLLSPWLTWWKAACHVHGDTTIARLLLVHHHSIAATLTLELGKSSEASQCALRPLPRAHARGDGDALAAAVALVSPSASDHSAPGLGSDAVSSSHHHHHHNVPRRQMTC